MAKNIYTVEWLQTDFVNNFECLYKMMYKSLYIFARNFLRDEGVAEDIVQDVFESLWHKVKKMPAHVCLTGYLRVSIKNLCIDYHRKLKIVDEYNQHLVASESFVYVPYEDDEGKERYERLRNLLQELPDMQRKVLQLSFEEGLSYREIAQCLNIAEGTIHTHVKRAYKYIKTHLVVLLLCMFVS